MQNPIRMIQENRGRGLREKERERDFENQPNDVQTYNFPIRIIRTVAPNRNAAGVNSSGKVKMQKRQEQFTGYLLDQSKCSLRPAS